VPDKKSAGVFLFVGIEALRAGIAARRPGFFRTARAVRQNRTRAAAAAWQRGSRGHPGGRRRPIGIGIYVPLVWI